MREVRIQPLYMDYSTHRQAMHAVLKWCDACWNLRELLPPGLTGTVRDDLTSQLGDQAIFRRNRIQFFSEPQRWPRDAWFEARGEVIVHSALVDVGTSSFVICRDLSVDGVPLAKVESTIVVVDAETKSKSEPIRERAELRSAMIASGGCGGCQLTRIGQQEASSMANQFVSRQPVRFVDCDELKHINNTVYPLLAEEVRALAADATFPNNQRDAAWLRQPLRDMEIEYRGQPKPGDLLEITLSWDVTANFCVFNFSVRGALVTVISAAAFEDHAYDERRSTASLQVAATHSRL